MVTSQQRVRKKVLSEINSHNFVQLVLLHYGVPDGLLRRLQSV